MIIRKKPPKPHPPGTPFRHENHPRPVSRRDFLAAGYLGAQGMVIGSAWLGALLKSRNARAAGLDSDILPLLVSNQCNVPAGGGGLPYICFRRYDRTRERHEPANATLRLINTIETRSRIAQCRAGGKPIYTAVSGLHCGCAKPLPPLKGRHARTDPGTARGTEGS